MKTLCFWFFQISICNTNERKNWLKKCALGTFSVQKIDLQYENINQKYEAEVEEKLLFETFCWRGRQTRRQTFVRQLWRRKLRVKRNYSISRSRKKRRTLFVFDDNFAVARVRLVPWALAMTVNGEVWGNVRWGRYKGWRHLKACWSTKRLCEERTPSVEKHPSFTVHWSKTACEHALAYSEAPLQQKNEHMTETGETRAQCTWRVEGK